MQIGCRSVAARPRPQQSGRTHPDMPRSACTPRIRGALNPNRRQPTPPVPGAHRHQAQAGENDVRSSASSSVPDSSFACASDTVAIRPGRSACPGAAYATGRARRQRARSRSGTRSGCSTLQSAQCCSRCERKRRHARRDAKAARSRPHGAGRANRQQRDSSRRRPVRCRDRLPRRPPCLRLRVRAYSRPRPDPRVPHSEIGGPGRNRQRRACRQQRGWRRRGLSVVVTGQPGVPRLHSRARRDGLRRPTRRPAKSRSRSARVPSRAPELWGKLRRADLAG